jgi:predicted glutamine amidotransferase
MEILQECWNSNPDGAGFALINQHKGKNFAFEIHKGFMTWDSFVKAFIKLNLANYEGDLFLHFRISTHGGVCQGNTHPFPITEDKKILKATSVLTDTVLMHNGVLPITPIDKEISDTMQLVKYLAEMPTHYTQALTMLEPFLGTNKIALATPKEIKLYGEWQKQDGVYYSNMNWQHLLYKDDSYQLYATKQELHFLKQDTCPNCGYNVYRDFNGYYCDTCGILWREKEKTQKYHQKTKWLKGLQQF